MKKPSQPPAFEPPGIAERVLLATYWILFVIAPTVMIYYWLPENWDLAGILTGVALILLSEFGFRRWLGFWKMITSRKHRN